MRLCFPHFHQKAGLFLQGCPRRYAQSPLTSASSFRYGKVPPRCQKGTCLRAAPTQSALIVWPCYLPATLRPTHRLAAPSAPRLTRSFFHAASSTLLLPNSRLTASSTAGSNLAPLQSHRKHAPWEFPSSIASSASAIRSSTPR